LNLDHWRENNVAYCSHQTLFDEGSTGQKQIKNIETLFKRKKDAQVWLFDESDNALDDENKKKFTDRLDNFFKNKDKKKLIIRINH
jgi:ABC-type bacteriocin/lantibiotic exporter with double-glycine peptidase domain